MNRTISRGVRCVAALAATALFTTACSGSDNATPDTEVADTEVADTEVGDTAAPDTAVADTAAPDTASAFGDDGFPYTLPDGDASVVFPGEPEPFPLEIPVGDITISADGQIYETATEGYFVIVADYPDGLLLDDPDTALIGGRDGAVSNVGGTLNDSEFVELSGIRGVKFDFSFGEGASSGLAVAQFFVHGDRMYQVFGLGESAKVAMFEAFIDTFEFSDAVGEN